MIRFLYDNVVVELEIGIKWCSPNGNEKCQLKSHSIRMIICSIFNALEKNQLSGIFYSRMMFCNITKQFNQ